MANAWKCLLEREVLSNDVNHISSKRPTSGNKFSGSIFLVGVLLC